MKRGRGWGRGRGWLLLLPLLLLLLFLLPLFLLPLLLPPPLALPPLGLHICHPSAYARTCLRLHSFTLTPACLRSLLRSLPLGCVNPSLRVCLLLLPLGLRVQHPSLYACARLHLRSFTLTLARPPSLLRSLPLGCAMPSLRICTRLPSPPLALTFARPRSDALVPATWSNLSVVSVSNR
jgi:hypothetical protein